MTHEAPSHRYGAPMPRYAVVEAPRVERRLETRSSSSGVDVVLGSAPTLIDFDPAGPERVLAYVDRVDRQADKMQRAYREWAGARWGTDVPAEEQTAPTSDQLRFLGDWPSFYAKWKAHVVSFSDSPIGIESWSPSAEWDKTLAFETELEKLRRRFDALIAAEPPKVKAKVDVPEAPPVQKDGSKGFEDPGGIASGADAIPWGTIGTLVFVVAGAVVIAAVAPAFVRAT